MAEEQNPSHYVFLLRKLELQPVEADTQQEGFVRQHVNQASIAFFPSKAMCMQAQRDDSQGGDLQVPYPPHTHTQTPPRPAQPRPALSQSLPQRQHGLGAVQPA